MNTINALHAQKPVVLLCIRNSFCVNDPLEFYAFCILAAYIGPFLTGFYINGEIGHILNCGRYKLPQVFKDYSQRNILSFL